MRLQGERAPNLVHGAVRYARLAGQVPGRPMGQVRRRPLEGQSEQSERFSARCGRSGNPATSWSAKRRRKRLICTTVYATRYAISPPARPSAPPGRAGSLGSRGDPVQTLPHVPVILLTTIGPTRLAMAPFPENIHDRN
jgi:hypothetical protein